MERRVDTPGSCATENTGEGPVRGEAAQVGGIISREV